MTQITTYRDYTISQDTYGRGYRVHTDRMFIDCWYGSVDEAKSDIDAKIARRIAAGRQAATGGAKALPLHRATTESQMTKLTKTYSIRYDNAGSWGVYYGDEKLTSFGSAEQAGKYIDGCVRMVALDEQDERENWWRDA